MQVRMLYVSRAVGPQTTTVTASILAKAQASNAADGICGVLCQGQGLYLQALEGERGAVNRLYARIVADRTVDSHVKKLRRKIADLDPSRELIHSVYGVGYKFEPDSDG